MTRIRKRKFLAWGVGLCALVAVGSAVTVWVSARQVEWLPTRNIEYSKEREDASFHGFLRVVVGLCLGIPAVELGAVLTTSLAVMYIEDLVAHFRRSRNKEKSRCGFPSIGVESVDDSG